MIPLEAIMVVVTRTALEASLAYAAPNTPDWLVLGRAREFHLVHCVLFAKKLAAMSAIDLSVRIAKSFAAERIRATVKPRRPLPMCPAHKLFRIHRGMLFHRNRRHRAAPIRSHQIRWNWRRHVVVRFKGLQSPQLLIDQCQWLKLSGLCHLLHEPGLGFILFDLLQISMVVVDVPALTLDHCAEGRHRRSRRCIPTCSIVEESSAAVRT